MNDRLLQLIEHKAQKIAACEQEISDLVEMVGLLNTQISNCRRIIQALQHCPGATVAEDGEDSPVPKVHASGGRRC